MNKPSKKLKSFFILLAVVLAALLGYFVILPEASATQYIERVHRAGGSLRDGYLELEHTTGETLVDDPGVTTTSIVPQIEALLNLLREDRITLTRFTAEASDYHPLPYTGFTSKARAAQALKTRSVAFTAQSKDAFQKYEELITFIKQYDAASSTIEQQVESFNAIPDLNIYAGRADEVRDIAEQVRATARSFEGEPTPHEATAFKAASVQAFMEIADGFDIVARGLQIPADDVIYDGASKIDAVDQKVNGPNQAIYRNDVLSSRTIKSIQELREKLDLILP
jgi:hypothetical protein